MQRTGPKTKKHYDALLELYTRYSHTPDTIIAVEGLYKKTPQVGKGKHQRKAGRTQHHALVTWAPSLQPGWLVHVAQQLEYAVLRVTPALPEDEHCFGHFQRPCEHCQEPCRPADHNTLRCDVCQRHYHAKCGLDPCHQDDATTYGDVYTCNECTTGYSNTNKQDMPTTTTHPTPGSASLQCAMAT